MSNENRVTVEALRKLAELPDSVAGNAYVMVGKAEARGLSEELRQAERKAFEAGKAEGLGHAKAKQTAEQVMGVDLGAFSGALTPRDCYTVDGLNKRLSRLETAYGTQPKHPLTITGRLERLEKAYANTAARTDLEMSVADGAEKREQLTKRIRNLEGCAERSTHVEAHRELEKRVAALESSYRVGGQTDTELSRIRERLNGLEQSRESHSIKLAKDYRQINDLDTRLQYVEQHCPRVAQAIEQRKYEVARQRGLIG